jgi:hypothetical protein
MHGKGILTKRGPPKQRFQIESRHGALKSQKLIPGTGGGGAAGGSRMEPNQEEKVCLGSRVLGLGSRV